MPDRSSLLRQLPQVDEFLRHPLLKPLVEQLSHPWAAKVVRRVLEARREALLAGAPSDLPTKLDQEDLAQEAARALAGALRPSLTRLINATGVIIHTNLGRSPLAPSALEQVLEAAAHYSNLEYDLALKERGSRQDHIEGLLKELTGADAALVVNNNAAAVLLALNTVAKGREVIISRGQLIEIGGSFRLPEIMAASGAILREVGTTNKTYLRDYEAAITSETGALLKVHPSNFRILGFTRAVELAELVDLGRRYALPVLEDLGSGCLVDLSRYGLEREPTVQEAVAAGADLVMFSGDKLLGGPQAGVVLGSRDLVAHLKKNPLTRALRSDKMTLAGLEATLRLYFDEPRVLSALPTLRMITLPLQEVERVARNLARSIRRRLKEKIKIVVQPSQAQVGGGALPQAALPSRALALTVPGLSATQLEAALRQGVPPVIGRVEDQRVLLDVRTLLPDDPPLLLTVLERLGAGIKSGAT